MEKIELIGISKAYGKEGNMQQALRNIDLSISKGEFTAIMGKSGCGKTTLLNLLGGILKPEQGRYLFDGEDVLQFRDKQMAQFRNQKVGFIVQNFALVNEMTVYQNAMLPLRYSHVGKAEAKKRVCEALESLGILQCKDKYPPQLSGGERQRTAIARILAADTQVILADEPTGALDEENGRHIVSIFRELNRAGKTIVMVTHDEELASAASRIIRLKDGEIVS